MPPAETHFRVAIAVTYRSGYEEDVCRGIIDYRHDADHWLFCQAGHLPFQQFDQIDLTAVDGVIGNFHDQQLAQQVIEAGIPAVNFSSLLEDIPLPRVGPDDHAIGQMGARFLLERGFVNFAFLTRGDDWYSKRRLGAFRQVIEHDAGHRCNAFDQTSSDEEADLAAIERWLRELPRPIAIMAANDFRGRQVINIASRIGLRVPDDIAVLGVDNDEWFTSLVTTPLSSVNSCAREIGHRAASMLDQLMRGQPVSTPQWVEPAGVVSRRSTDVLLAEDPIVARALRYIRDHCAQTITVDDVLDELGISRRSLEVRLKRSAGITPQVAIFRAQVELAKTMLATTDQPMGRIALACGFQRQNHFNDVFKRMTGVTPGQYRKQRAR